MFKFKKILFTLFVSIIFLASSAPVSAEKGCMCYSDIAALGVDGVFQNKNNLLKATCVEATTSDCTDKVKILGKGKEKTAPICKYIDAVGGVSSEKQCEKLANEWWMESDSMMKKAGKEDVSATESPGGTSVISTLIQKCGKSGPLDADCADITVFVSLLLQLTNYLFSIIGALALGAFVYGGFILILSQGNPEKLKQGSGAMINAVIGLLVAFGGYVLVGFLGEILNLGKDFGLL